MGDDRQCVLRPEVPAPSRAYARVSPLGEYILHVDADMGVRSVRGPKGMFPPVRPLALLAEHGFDDIGDRRQLKRFAQERGVHAARGFGDGAFGK